MCACVHVSMWMCPCVCVGMFVCACACVRVYGCVCGWVDVCARLCALCGCVQVCVCACVCVHAVTHLILESRVVYELSKEAIGAVPRLHVVERQRQRRQSEVTEPHLHRILQRGK